MCLIVKNRLGVRIGRGEKAFCKVSAAGMARLPGGKANSKSYFSKLGSIRCIRGGIRCVVYVAVRPVAELGGAVPPPNYAPSIII